MDIAEYLWNLIQVILEAKREDGDKLSSVLCGEISVASSSIGVMLALTRDGSTISASFEDLKVSVETSSGVFIWMFSSHITGPQVLTRF